MLIIIKITTEGGILESILEENKNRTIIAAIDLKRTQEISFEDSIEEVKELVKACNLNVVDILTQKKDKPENSTYLGHGKLEELRLLIEYKEANLVVFDDELSGVQIRNLEEYLGVDILDRTGLILAIFGDRAKTREGKLQVELATLQYEKPRLIGLGKILSRVGAGRLARGQGESQLEIDRRTIADKIVDIRRELLEVKKHRELQRKQRKRNEIPSVALVGYTNAGKSTIMNYFMAISSGDVPEHKAFVKDMLFATLDPFSKKITLEDNKSFILTDTVGFVSKLPHNLVESFKSTLEEVNEASLLIYVVDISSENFEHQLKVTRQVIGEVNENNTPYLVAYNKIDKVSEEQLKKRGDVSHNFVDISALTGEGIDNLITEIKKVIFKDETEVELLIPYVEGSITSNIQNSRTVLAMEHREEGTYLKVILKNIELSKYEKYII